MATIAQHYRDRADAENNFDELKNQWSWAGFTTQDLLRCQVLAAYWGVGIQLVDAVYASGDPRQTRRGDHDAAAVAARYCPTDAPWSPNHGNDHQLARAGAADEGRFAAGPALFLQWVRATTEQLTRAQRWRLILSWIFRQFLHGRVVGTPSYVTDTPF